jgi:hypothetical protein
MGQLILRSLLHPMTIYESMKDSNSTGKRSSGNYTGSQRKVGRSYGLFQTRQKTGQSHVRRSSKHCTFARSDSTCMTRWYTCETHRRCPINDTSRSSNICSYLPRAKSKRSMGSEFPKRAWRRKLGLKGMREIQMARGTLEPRPQSSKTLLDLMTMYGTSLLDDYLKKNVSFIYTRLFFRRNWHKDTFSVGRTQGTSFSIRSAGAGQQEKSLSTGEDVLSASMSVRYTWTLLEN